LLQSALTANSFIGYSHKSFYGRPLIPLQQSHLLINSKTYAKVLFIYLHPFFLYRDSGNKIKTGVFNLEINLEFDLTADQILGNDWLLVLAKN